MYSLPVVKLICYGVEKEVLTHFSCMKSFRLKSWEIIDLAVFLNVESAGCHSDCSYKHLMPCLLTVPKSKVLRNVYGVKALIFCYSACEISEVMLVNQYLQVN